MNSEDKQCLMAAVGGIGGIIVVVICLTPRKNLPLAIGIIVATLFLVSFEMLYDGFDLLLQKRREKKISKKLK